MEIDEDGAQLVSIKNKSNHLEYLWQGSEKFWKRQAPNLFPIVGRLKNDEYEYNNHRYSMGQHGFARDTKFKTKEINQNEVIFELESNEKSKLIYPFDFKLTIKYELVKNEINVSYNVINNGLNEMYFSIGAHPGFNLPIGNEKFEDYEVKISSPNDLKRIFLSDGLSKLNNPVSFNDKDNLKIDRSLFKDDAVILDSGVKQDYQITLTNSKNDHGIVINSYDNKFVGIWSMYPQNAPFVCIEPWWGIADSVDSNQKIVEKSEINRLNSNDQFNAKYKISIL